MTVFGRRKDKGNHLSILAPLEGELISVKEVEDPTFSEEMLGQGVAIRPSMGRAVSPVKGVVTQMFETGHAVSLTSDEGVEVLIHVGLDTIRLQGACYTVHAREGDAVKPGDLLIAFDLTGISEAGFDTVTPVVICNSHEFEDFWAVQTGKMVREGEEIIRLRKKP